MYAPIIYAFLPDRPKRWRKDLDFTGFQPCYFRDLLIALKFRGCKINLSVHGSFADSISTAHFCPCATGVLGRPFPEGALNVLLSEAVSDTDTCMTIRSRFFLRAFPSCR